MWRYHANPIIDRNPDSEVARVFNSSVVPTSGGFVGAFRADHRNARPDRRRGRSADGLRWTLDPIVIPWQDEAGRAVPVTSPGPSGGPDLGLAAALGAAVLLLLLRGRSIAGGSMPWRRRPPPGEAAVAEGRSAR